MTTAEVVHAFKHAMAHSLGPAPPPSARPGSKRIAERRALAETSANVRAEAAPSPVKAAASNGVKPARTIKPPSKKAIASLARHASAPMLPTALATVAHPRDESSKENATLRRKTKTAATAKLRDIVTADGSDLGVLRSPLRRIDAGAKPPNAKTPTAGKTPSRLRRAESAAAKTPAPAASLSSLPVDDDWDDVDVTPAPPSVTGGDAEMESEIGAVVALAAMSGGKEAPAIAMSKQPCAGGEDAGPRKSKPPAFVAATPFRAPAPVQMTPRAPPPPSFFEDTRPRAPSSASSPVGAEDVPSRVGNEATPTTLGKRKTSPTARSVVVSTDVRRALTTDLEAARAAAALGRWRAAYAVRQSERRSERRVEHLVSLLREQAGEFDAQSAKFREKLSSAKSELRDAKGREEELRAALTASQMDVDDLTELVGSVTRKSAKTAWRLAARAGVERCKRIKVEEEVAASARRRRMDKQSAEEDQAAVDKLNDTLGDVSRALAATRAELEVAMAAEVKGELKDSLRAKVAEELRRELRESTMAELRREAREEAEEERRVAGGYARLAAIGAAAARAGGGMVTPAAALGAPSFPPSSTSGTLRTPGHAFGGAMHPYARMFPDASGRIPNPPARQSQQSATAPDPEPSPKERTAVDEAEIAAAVAVVRECDRKVLERALGPGAEYTPSEQLATLALQTAAKSRSPLNVLKGVDPGRLVRVHERAMEALAVSVEETARDLFSPITALTPSLAGGSVTATVVPPPGAGERRDGHELNASREREARGNAKKGWGAWLNFSV